MHFWLNGHNVYDRYIWKRFFLIERKKLTKVLGFICTMFQRKKGRRGSNRDHRELGNPVCAKKSLIFLTYMAKISGILGHILATFTMSHLEILLGTIFTKWDQYVFEKKPKKILVCLSKIKENITRDHQQSKWGKGKQIFSWCLFTQKFFFRCAQIYTKIAILWENMSKKPSWTM